MDVTKPSTEFLDLQAALAGEYSLQRELGRGGMGVVSLARDVQLDRDVAIKVLPSELARTAVARERFLREARTAAGLSHPHIVPIHRVGEARGFVFFVMSFVEGETLGERLRTKGPLAPAEATRVLREVAWALAYAHGRGIVHRDVKPDNILLEQGTGRALVTDFGIAYGGRDAPPDGDPGRIMGTAQFMSPEQAAAGSLDGRSDLYALGVVGYLAVSGRLPLEAPNLPALLVRKATETPPSVMRAAPGLPAALGAAIDRCLARERAERFADGEALADALVPAVQARPPLPPTLRAWLNSRNPLFIPYVGWAALFGSITLANLIVWLAGKRPDGFMDVLFLGALASAPVVPIIGHHLNRARLLFRSGHTLSDMRTALAIAAKERDEEEEVATPPDREAVAVRMLRDATWAAGTWSAVTIFMGLIQAVPDRAGPWVFVVPLGSTVALAALSNILHVSLVPEALRKRFRSGLRQRLWDSKLGAWLARRLGAPERSSLAGSSAFRATEAALGVAAAELFAALPKSHREQLAELPATVEALEAQAAEARAEVEMLAGLAPSAGSDVKALAARREVAAAHLAESVAALEGIRLDLLRLHAGASDLAPLTTLMDAVRHIGEDVRRLVDAQREVDGSIRNLRAARTPTPA